MIDQWQSRRRVAPPVRRISKEWLRWPPVTAYALFLTSGALKSDERLLAIPFDLTVGMAAVTLAYVVWRFVMVGNPLPKQALWLVALFAAFLIPEFTAGPATAYGNVKVINLFTLTLLAAIAPFFVIRNRREARDFFLVLGGLALIISLDIGLQVLAGEPGYRLTGFAGSAIWSGRMAGLGLVLAMTAVITKATPTVTGGIVATISSVALIASGTRGALVGAVAAILVVYPLTHSSGQKAKERLAVPLVIAIAFVASLTFSQDWNLNRFTSLTSGDIGSGGEYRLEAYEISFTQISESPGGIGWGAYGNVIGVFDVFDTDGAYPHNLVLEVAMEAGWVPAAIMIVVMGSVFRIAIREGTRRLESVFAIALLVFAFVVAMFSGDINGNRLLFAALGGVLALSSLDSGPVGFALNRGRRRVTR